MELLFANTHFEYWRDYGRTLADQHSQYVLDLGGEIRESLGDFGLDILTPRDRSSRAGNISFATNDDSRIESALREQGILV